MESSRLSMFLLHVNYITTKQETPENRSNAIFCIKIRLTVTK